MIHREEVSRQERAVLGAVLKDADCVAEVVQVIRPDDFREDAHRSVFKAVCELYGGGHRPDAVTVANVLKREGQLLNVGGYAFLSDLLVDSVASPAIAAHYARLVRDASILRELGFAAAEIGVSAADPRGGADEILAQAEQRILGIAEAGVTGSAVHAKVAVGEMRERITARAQSGQSGYSGLRTGLLDLDNLTGGLQDSELVLLAARPSAGKTSMAITFARHLCVENNVPAFFASLEQSRVELVERLTCCHSGVDSHKLKRGLMGADEKERFRIASAAVEKSPLYIDDTSNQSTLRIAANARRLKNRHGIRLVMVDYLGLIDPANRKDSRQEQVASISRSLKHIAKEVKVPVLCLAQLNRQVEYRADECPKMADLRDSGAQEQDSDVVLLLWVPNKKEAPNVVQIKVEKQRNGRTGPVNVYFRRECYRFETMAQGYRADEADEVPEVPSDPFPRN